MRDKIVGEVAFRVCQSTSALSNGEEIIDLCRNEPCKDVSLSSNSRIFYMYKLGLYILQKKVQNMAAF